MGNIKKVKVTIQQTDIQLVRRSMADHMAVMLLNDKELTKEQRLFSWILGECDANGIAKIDELVKEGICKLLGMPLQTYYTYVSSWRDRGLIAKGTGKFLAFNVWTMIDTERIVIHKTTNGMTDIK